MQGDLLEKAVKAIRAKTSSGVINLNSNASRSDVVSKLVESGLDSMRISMNSSREEYYSAYYRPVNYGFDDVLESWRIMKDSHRHLSLNLFVFPGLTDEMSEIERLSGLIEDLGLDLIQLRNHNIDPDWYIENIGYSYSGSRIGVRNMVKVLQKRFPKTKFGYFNPYLSRKSG